MWTTRRVVLLTAGFIFFAGGYQVYAQLLGQYDGLPPLPQEHRQVLQPGDIPQAVGDPPRTRANKRLILAFGPLCNEVKRRVQLSWEKEGVAVAAEDWDIIDGQLHLKDVSVALFGKNKNGEPNAEIHTIRGKRAQIQFDRPLTRLSPNEATSRRPVSGRLESDDDLGVVLQSNRRTPQPNDDILLRTKWLAYDDKQHLFWTDAPILLTEADPFETKLTGQGLKVFLDTDTEPARDPKKRSKLVVNGVKQIRVEKEVYMFRYIDAKTGFLGGAERTDTARAGPANGKPVEKSQLNIRSQGPFIYDFQFYDPENDRARFVDNVEVLRSHVISSSPNGKSDPNKESVPDELRCDKLLLQFRRQAREGKPAGAQTETAEKMMLVAAHATGKEVVLDSQLDGLHAVGVEMLYETIADKRYRTTLKGGPNIRAQRDRSDIQARGSLVLETQQGEIQAAHVIGPGQINMFGRKDVAGTARWTKDLKLSKDGVLDLLVLTGDATEKASFDDTENRNLRGEQLAVWLEPESIVAGKRRERRPRRVHAAGNTSATTPEVVIDRADRLTMEFEDGEPAGTPAQPAEKPNDAKRNNAQTSPLAADSSQAGRASQGPNPTNEAPAKRARPPIHMTSGVIDVRLVRKQGRPDLKSVWAQGKVHVLQQALTPEDKPLEVQSETLMLTRTSDGDILDLFGEPAEAQYDQLFLVGPEIRLDQRENTASVKGIGSMKHPVSSDLDGNKLKQPTDLIIHWKEWMYFDGTVGEFGGGIQAEQENSRLSGQKLQVFLEKPMSLKEARLAGDRPQKADADRKAPAAGQPPLISKLICDGQVRFEKGLQHEGKWKDFQLIEAPQLDFHKPDSELKVTGPGVVRILQLGPKQLGPQTAENTAAKPAAGRDQEMKLTEVAFDGRMIANQKTGKVKFQENVELIYLPSEDPYMDINAAKLPPETLEVSSSALELRSRKVENRVVRDFIATGNVRVHSQRYHAQADIVKYEEIKDQLIFEGEAGREATLYWQELPGGPPRPVQAKKIFYYPKTNEWSFNGARFLDAGQLRQSPRPAGKK